MGLLDDNCAVACGCVGVLVCFCVDGSKAFSQVSKGWNPLGPRTLKNLLFLSENVWMNQCSFFYYYLNRIQTLWMNTTSLTQFFNMNVITDTFSIFCMPTHLGISTKKQNLNFSKATPLTNGASDNIKSWRNIGKKLAMGWSWNMILQAILGFHGMHVFFVYL